jgi:hypothetical protein
MCVGRGKYHEVVRSGKSVTWVQHVRKSQPYPEIECSGLLSLVDSFIIEEDLIEMLPKKLLGTVFPF